MKKKTAIELFGSASKLSRAVQYTRGAIHNWPDELDRRRSDQVIGAAVRVGKLSPAQAKELIEHERQGHERSQGTFDRRDDLGDSAGDCRRSGPIAELCDP